MQTVNKEKLQHLIERGRTVGKDVTELEEELKNGIKLQLGTCRTQKAKKSPPGVHYISTGPYSPEDFDDPSE